MRRRTTTISLILLLSIGTTACSARGGKVASTHAFTAEQVRLGGRLAQMRGHHLVALELYRTGDTVGATAHAYHPIEEILPSVESEVRERDSSVAGRLEFALKAVPAATTRGGATASVTAAVDAAREAIEHAETAILGRARTTTPYRASLVAVLTDAAHREYVEAVREGKIAELIEYQDGYGFVHIAEQIYAAIAPALAKTHARSAGAIDEAFSALNAAFPSTTAPARPASTDSVGRAAARISTELQESAAAVLVPAVDTDKAFENIESLLGRILTAYADGKPDEATELAVDVYLDNYELLETEVIGAAPAINSELEPILSTELRTKIKSGVPATELAALIAHARTLLAKAREAVTAS